MRRNTLILCVCFLLISAPSRSSAQPSFDCADALYADEVAICRNDDLAAKDKIDDQTFKQLYQQPNMAQPAHAARNDFIATRRQCGFEIDCIRRQQDAFLDLLAKLKVDPNFKPVAQKSARSSGENDAPRRPLRTLTPSMVDQMLAMHASDGGSAFPALLQRAFVPGIAIFALALIFLLGRKHLMAWMRRIAVVVSSALAPISLWLPKLLAAWKLRKPAMEDRRREPRWPTLLRPGALLDINGEYMTECRVVDRSENGARVQADKNLEPGQVIRFRDDVEEVTFVAKVVWRKANDFGLMILGR